MTSSPIRYAGLRLVLILLVSVVFVCQLTDAVKHKDFKRCDQSGFCSRNRAFADAVASGGGSNKSFYYLDSSQVQFSKGQFQSVIVKSSTTNDDVFKFPINITFLETGLARVTIDEERRRRGDIELRHNSKARKQRCDEAAKWALTGAGLKSSQDAKVTAEGDGFTEVTYGPDQRYEALIRHSPFSVQFRKDGHKELQLNERGFFNIEHWRAQEKQIPNAGSAQDPLVNNKENGDDESTWWDETFNGFTDSKPRGPESVAMDVTFLGYEYVYGLAEHATSLSLNDTRGGDGNYDEPYRLFNSDVFEYELHSPMTLYGAIPFMQGHRKGSSAGVFWLNGAETWVDVTRSKSAGKTLSMGLGGQIDTKTHWISENGILDFFVMMESTPADISHRYGELTGYTDLPPTFAMAYHQSRWNYVSDEDVKDVDRLFDKHAIPYDVIWLDLEWTDNRQWFRWDLNSFRNPLSMNKQLDESERKVVVLTDPHIKNEASYDVDKELSSKGLAIKDKDGNNYVGWCWPGSSHWVDTFNPAALTWWKSLFTYDRFSGSMSNLWIWNDMNEPSVFNGPDVSMPRDNLHYGEWEHRDVHNVYGLTFHNATYHAVIERKRGELLRPFVLTRAFFAGSQRVGPMWTGDNLAEWSHLKISLPMILNQGISGYPFAGADVGGFFGNPEKELLVRWYQAGAFYPFFRAHAHIDTRRREPYLIGEPYTQIMAQAVRLRYQLLPAWYTAFYQASVDGSPIVRPQYYVHPTDENGFAMDDQFYLGDSGLLVKPVTTEGATSAEIYLAEGEDYYDYLTYAMYQGRGKSVTIDAPLGKIPLLMRGGHVIPRKDRPRKSSGLMKYDPYTLVVVVGRDSKAEGDLYIDDGETFDYREGVSIHRRFVLEASTLRSEDAAATKITTSTKGSKKMAAYLERMSNVRVERIIIVNAPQSWEGLAQVPVRTDGALSAKSIKSAPLSWHSAAPGRAAWAIIRDPGVLVGSDWYIDFSLSA